MSAAMLVPLVAGDTLTIVLFLAVVALTLYITFWASRQSKTTTDYYAGGRSFSGFQNGLAVSGDYMSAASFLGISGAIAIYGYDGFLYSIGFLVAWLVALLLIAELLRNSGRFTMADQLAYRMRQTPVRSAAATSTIVVSIFYLLAQMVGAGSLVGLLLGVDSPALKNLVIVGVGVLMIIYVTFGGMKGTTWVQIVKAVLLMLGTILITFLVLLQFGFNLSDLLGTAAEKSGKGGLPATWTALRQGPGRQDRLLVAWFGPGPRHRWPAAHPHSLLHHAHGQGGTQVGALGDRADRLVLLDDIGAGLWRRGAGPHRPG